MFIYLDIRNDENNTPSIHVSFDHANAKNAMFPATRDGAYALGRHIAATCPGANQFSCSSSIDFADEYGVAMTGDDICNAVLLGMGCTIAAF
jgi:hypothetical protein